MIDSGKIKLGNFINGRWQAGEGGERSILNPATGSVVETIAEASAQQVEEAIAAARKAQHAWARRSPLERSRYMHRIAALIKENAVELARLVVMEQGKPITEARGEVGGAAEFFTYYAEFARRIQGEILPSDAPGEQIWIQRVPVGVVGAIIPWNYPAALVSRKTAPALIAGNTVVLKPHEETPLSALFMAQLFEQAELPAGVVNIVTGTGTLAGSTLTASPDIDLLTMTGSVPTGRRIMAAAASNLTPVSLELGGKAPFIVAEDADLDLAVASAVTSRFMNCGQVCICNERMFVHDTVYNAFMERFLEATKALRIGNPLSDQTDLGPKVSRAEMEKVETAVASAIKEGARPLLAGGRPAAPPMPGNGNWLLPTVLSDVTPDMSIMRNEVFGPVIPVMRVSEVGQAIDMANDSPYGLSAYLFTNDFRRIMQAVNDIRFGEIYINRIGPESIQGYHTGYRNSGPGGDDGIHGLETYLHKKTVYVNYSGASPVALMPW